MKSSCFVSVSLRRFYDLPVFREESCSSVNQPSVDLISHGSTFSKSFRFRPSKKRRQTCFSSWTPVLYEICTLEDSRVPADARDPYAFMSHPLRVQVNYLLRRHCDPFEPLRYHAQKTNNPLGIRFVLCFLFGFLSSPVISHGDANEIEGHQEGRERRHARALKAPGR